MDDASLDDLERRRARLYDQLAATGDFRRGTISENYRRCGKPNCACAEPGHPGHGPRYLWTRTVAGRAPGAGSCGRGGGQGACRAGELPAVRRRQRGDRGGQRGDLRGPPAGSRRRRRPRPRRGTKKGAPRPDRSGVRRRGRTAGRAGRATRWVRGRGLRHGGAGGAHGDDPAGRSLLEQLLATDTGHRRPADGLRAGHRPSSSATGTRTIDTVLGRIRLRRAYYHCAACQRGVVPRDGELGVAGGRCRRDCAGWCARAAAAVPFAGAADLLAELAGVRLSTKRVERSAEADGPPPPQRSPPSPQRSRAGTVAVLPPADRGVARTCSTSPSTAPACRWCPPPRRPRRQGRGRAGPHPRGQTRLPVHPDQPRRRRPAGARPGHHQLRAHLRPGRAVHHPGARRGPPPRRRAHPPTRRPRRRRGVDLEPGHQDPARSHPDRRHLPRPRTRPRPRQATRTASSATTTPTGWPPGWPTSTTATSKPSSTPPPGYRIDDDTARDTDESAGLLQQQRPTHALRPLPRPGHVHRLRRRRSRLQSLVGQRLKLSGMRWNIPGATGILTLRCHRASNRWDHIWPQPHNQTAPPEPTHPPKSRSTTPTYKFGAHPFAVLPQHVVGAREYPACSHRRKSAASSRVHTSNETAAAICLASAHYRPEKAPVAAADRCRRGRRREARRSAFGDGNTVWASAAVGR